MVNVVPGCVVTACIDTHELHITPPCLRIHILFHFKAYTAAR
jgi:hypothetical protein